ncbi:MAG: ketopantoate reductase family protein [Spirochaetaceae bacterium]
MVAIKRVLILGAGALGAMYARPFATTNGVEAAFIARGERAERLRAHGVFVNGTPVKLRVIEDPAGTEEGGRRDESTLVLVALKHHQLDEGIEVVRPFVGANTLLLSVMNGIGSEGRLADAFGRERVVHAVAVGMDAVREDNRVRYSAMGKIRFGRGFPELADEGVEAVKELFERCGIACVVEEDIRRSIWNKFMLNVGVNQLSALLGAPYRVFQGQEAAKRLLRATMREVVAIAEAEGVNLKETDIEPWFDILATLSPEGKTSMLQDMEAGRKTEVEMFAGQIVELAQKHRLPAPINSCLLDMIKVRESLFHENS